MDHKKSSSQQWYPFSQKTPSHNVFRSFEPIDVKVTHFTIDEEEEELWAPDRTPKCRCLMESNQI